MKLYTLTISLDNEKIRSGTVQEDYTVGQLISQADDWAGKDLWNQLELAYYKDSA